MSLEQELVRLQQAVADLTRERLALMHERDQLLRDLARATGRSVEQVQIGLRG